MRAPFAVAALLAASLSQAQFLISELSFGHAGRISPPESRENIPGFTLQGNPQMPEVLSNRVILTPLAPGNVRGAIWSQQTLNKPQWIADVDFRANGPDRAGGNLNIWLVKDGAKAVAANSVYTAGRFDGLAIVLTSQGGQGGMLRAYLNDGTVDYSSRQNIDDLAFGRCTYAYRNLGRPSQIKFRQTPTEFSVELDGRLCFKTNQITIPNGYYFGLTAATPDTPDSFEIFKLVVMSETGQYGSTFSNEDSNQKKVDDAKRQQQQQQQQQQTPNKEPPVNRQQNRGPEEVFPEGAVDESADVFQSSKTQFADLHNRLQSTNHQLSAVHRTLSRHMQQDEQRHEEVMRLLGELRSDLRKLDEISALNTRLQELESEVQGMRRDTMRKLQSNERSVKDTLTDHHSTLSQTLADATPGHGRLILIIVGSQVVLAGVYVFYKRRKNNLPKKYL